MVGSVVLGEVEDGAGVFGGDTATQIGGKLVEQEDGRLPTLRAAHGASGTVVLIRADDEASGEVGEELEPFGLNCAAGEEGRILAEKERIDFDFHVEVGMSLEKATAKIGSAVADAVPASVGPKDFGVRVVSEKALESGEIFLKLRGIGGGSDAEGKRDGLGDDVEVKIDGDIMLRGDVGEEEEERVVGGRGFVDLARRERKMFGAHFAEAESTCAEDLLRDLLEFSLDIRAGDS